MKLQLICNKKNPTLVDESNLHLGCHIFLLPPCIIVLVCVWEAPTIQLKYTMAACQCSGPFSINWARMAPPPPILPPLSHMPKFKALFYSKQKLKLKKIKTDHLLDCICKKKKKKKKKNIIL